MSSLRLSWKGLSEEGLKDSPRSGSVLVLALDGASFDVIRPLASAGRLPNLDLWMKQGRAAPLQSTIPPVTFPAWSSFLTGLGPGRHGIFDFTQKLPGSYRLRFVNASDRAGRSIFQRVSQAGGTVLVLGMPATYPPEPVRGLLVAGFDAPVSVGTDASSASDPSLYRSIAARAGPWMRPIPEPSQGSPDERERAVETLLTRIDRKTAFALEALRQLRASRGGVRPDLMTVVFSESDTVGHHYWRDHDPNSPRHDPTASSLRRGAVAAVYEKLDAACGEIRAAYGEDALCVVVSDHGMGGAARHVVHLNRHLADSGLLSRTRRNELATDSLARAARNLALGMLSPRLAQRVFRRARGAAARIESAARFGGHDWRRTVAFSEEANTNPGVWINLRGREAEGRVAPESYERVRDQVIAALRDWKIPGRGPVVAAARRREEVYEGPYLARAPDIVVELALDRGYGLSLVPTPWTTGAGFLALRELADEELQGGRGRGMNGTHRSEGILITVGPGTPNAGLAGATLVDVAPSLLRTLGIPQPEPGEAFDGAAWGTPRRAYTPEEDRLVAERLRALGYLE